jgi:phosphoglycolate phosphatase
MVEISSGKWKIDGVGAVLFDKDGTFIDSHHYWGAIIIARSLAIRDLFGLNDDSLEGLEHSMGFCRRTNRLLPRGPIALVSREEVINHVLRHLATRNVKVDFEDVARLFSEVHKRMLGRIDESVRLIQEARSLFDSLQKKGIPMAVVTTDSVDNTQAILTNLGLDAYFSAVVGKESSTKPKETGEPALIALRELGVAATEAICIGDAPMDILMAQNSGCRGCIGVATGQISSEELSRYTPYVVSSLSELSVA